MKKLGYKIALILAFSSLTAFNVYAQGASQRPPLSEHQGIEYVFAGLSFKS